MSVADLAARRFLNLDTEEDSELRELNKELLREKIAFYRMQTELAKTLDEEANAHTLWLGIETELKTIELEERRKERSTIVYERMGGEKVTMAELFTQERIAKAESAVRRAVAEEKRERDSQERRKQGPSRPARFGKHQPRPKEHFNQMKGQEKLEAMKAEVASPSNGTSPQEPQKP